jgi:hypothetical protein
LLLTKRETVLERKPTEREGANISASALSVVFYPLYALFHLLLTTIL